VAAIRELGGKVEYEAVHPDQIGVFQLAPFGGFDSTVSVPGFPFAKVHVTLLGSWRGGEEGLRHLARLEYNWGATLQGCGVDVTNVKTSGLSQEAVQGLAARLPGVRVHERGASLGIRCPAFNDCMIGEVVKGGAADRAGLLPQDVIIGFEDQPIASFPDLVAQLMHRAPGEEVTLKVARGVSTLDVKVTLGGWDDLRTGSDRPPSLSTPPEPPPPAADLFFPPEIVPQPK
jgi:membrane-associated protease RseP (regulator of RpoE activity)